MVEHPEGRFEIVHGVEEIRVLKGKIRPRPPPGRCARWPEGG